MNVNHLTLISIKSYVKACKDLFYYIEVLRDEGHDLLVVPSRGAYPFLHAVRGHAHDLLDADKPEPRRRLLSQVEQLYLPFTADISPDQSIAPATIRKFWAHVLWAILNDARDDVAYRYTEFVRSLANGFPLQPTVTRGGKSGKFMFVDTVLSGRAICEIVQGFDAYGLTGCHYLLLIDHCGNDLKPAYRQKLVELQAANRATLVYVDQIFTEDEGPAMSGIWTVTMPELMDAAAVMIPELAAVGETGGALAYPEVKKRKDGANVAITVSNSILSNLLYSSVLGNDDVTAAFLADFQEHINKSDLQNKAYTKKVADPVIFKNIDSVTKTDVSGSHAMRAYFGHDKAKSLISEFLITYRQ